MKIAQQVKDEEWAKAFINKIEALADTNEENVKVTLGNVKSKKGKDYMLLKSQLNDIANYIRFVKSGSSIRITSARTYANALIRIADCIKKPFKELTAKDIENLLIHLQDEELSSTYIEWCKVLIKNFMKWLYGFKKRGEFPEVVDWINIRKTKSKNLPEILTQEEITKMLNACDNLRSRSLIHMLVDGGLRKGEAINATISSLVFDKYSAYIMVNGKTGPRKVRLISSVPDLKAWLNIHPAKNNPQAALFPSLSNRDYGGFMSDVAVTSIVHVTARRAKIGRRIYPHLFRHTNATYWARFLKEPEMRIRYGWSKNSNTPSLYFHISGDQCDEDTLVAAGLKQAGNDTLTKIEQKICTKCNEQNSPVNKFCSKCYYPLDIEAINQIDALKQIIAEKLLNSPDIIKAIEELGKDTV